MLSQTNPELLASANLHPGPILFLGKASPNLKILIETLLPTSLIAKANATTPYPFFTRTLETDQSPGFNTIFCLGPPELLEPTQLHWLLARWKTYLGRGGRILLRMHGANGRSWRAVLADYAEAARKAGCRVAEVNGLEIGFSFSGPVGDGGGQIDVFRYSVDEWIRSMGEAVARVGKVDRVGAQGIRRMIPLVDWELVPFGRLSADDVDRLVTGEGMRKEFYIALRASPGGLDTRGRFHLMF